MTRLAQSHASRAPFAPRWWHSAPISGVEPNGRPGPPRPAAANDDEIDSDDEETESDEEPQEEMPLWRSSLRRMSSALGLGGAKLLAPAAEATAPRESTRFGMPGAPREPTRLGSLPSESSPPEVTRASTRSRAVSAQL